MPLSQSQRRQLKRSDFAMPERAPSLWAYPVNSPGVAKLSLELVSQHGTPEDIERVKTSVRKRYPGIEVD